MTKQQSDNQNNLTSEPATSSSFKSQSDSETTSASKNTTRSNNSKRTRFLGKKTDKISTFQSRGLSLKHKIILAAIALSAVPLLAVGGIAHYTVKRLLGEQIERAQQQVSQTQLIRTQSLARQFEQFLEARLREVETVASDRLFTDPNLRQNTTPIQKQAVLNIFQEKIGFYDRIIFFSTEGQPLFQSESLEPLPGNYSDREHFQEAIRTKQVAIAKPGFSPTFERLGVEYAAPVKDAWTNQVIGVIVFYLPEKEIATLFESYEQNRERWYLLDERGIIFASATQEHLNRSSETLFPGVTKLYAARQAATGIYPLTTENNNNWLVSYTPITASGLYPEKYLGAMLAIDAIPASTALDALKIIVLLGTVVTILLVGAIAAYLANRLIARILTVNEALENIARGKLNTPIAISGRDELAQLGSRIDLMAKKLQKIIVRQAAVAKTLEIITKITRARTSQELEIPLSLLLREIRLLFKAERLLFYQFDENWSGTIIAESVAQGWSSTLGVKIEDPCFAQNYVEKYRRGRIQATRNIYEAGLTECHLKQLEPFEVKANLVVPVIVQNEREENELLGLLIAHQCSSTRIWSNSEIDYLKQVANQLGLALRAFALFNSKT